MLDERCVWQLHESGSFAQPRLQPFIRYQLVEIVALAAGRHPETDSRGIAQRPKHRDLMVAEKDGRVDAVTRVPKRANPEHPVADDQDRQIVRSHSSPGPSIRRIARVYEPIICSSVRDGRHCQPGPNTDSASSRANRWALANARVFSAPPLKTQKESQRPAALARRMCALRSHQPGPGSAVMSMSASST